MNRLLRRQAPARPGPPPFREGDYLTDQRGLYRVLHILKLRRRHAAIVEDCRTFELLILSPHDHSGLGLRVVRPA